MGALRSPRHFLEELQNARSLLAPDANEGDTCLQIVKQFSLASLDGKRFESRYLQVPELVKAVEKVREEQATANRPGQSLRSRESYRWVWQSMVAAALVCVVGAAVWFYLHRQPSPSMVAQLAPPGANVLNVHLTPGVVKAVDAKITEFEAPTGTKIRLVLELPGWRKIFRGFARISLVNANGSLRQVWETRNPVSSVAIGNGQEWDTIANSSVFERGDYILSLVDSSGLTVESYVFRVTAKQ
jgi:hypothetical protein